MGRTARILPFCGAVLLLWAAAVPALEEQELREALEAPEREIADRIRDPDRRPVEVLAFLGVEPGMRVLDVYAAGGYYTYILAHAVGQEGRVFAQNPPGAPGSGQDRGNATQGQVLQQKIERAGLENVVRVDRSLSDMELDAGSMDMVLISQILHDYYNRSPAAARALLDHVHRLLRPGGILGVIDHNGRPDLDNRRLHRIPLEDALSVLRESGFQLEQRSDLLSVPQDSHRRSIFDPMLGQTDRFLLRLRKPADDAEAP